MRPILLLFLIASFSLCARAQNGDVVRVIFPTFGSTDTRGREQTSVSKKAATLLGMQVWLTLRKADPERPNAKFGKGVVQWALDNTAPESNETAEEFAKKFSRAGDYGQMVLWGDAFRYGGEIVVEANLTLTTEATQGAQLLQATLYGASKVHRISLDFPSRHYEFAPVVLRSDILPKVDEPTEISMYKDASTEGVIGTLPGNFRRLNRVGDFIQVAVLDERGQESNGYIYSPVISEEPNEIIDFSGGLVRILRKDWGGALEQFKLVVENKNVPRLVKINSYIYMAAASDRLGRYRDSLTYSQQAFSLNPYMRTTRRYLCMAYLRQLDRLNFEDRLSRQFAWRMAYYLLHMESVFSPKDDQWVSQVRTFLRDVKI